MRTLILLAILGLASALPSRLKRQAPPPSICDATTGGYWLDTPEYPSNFLFDLATTCSGSNTYPNYANYSIFFMVHWGQSYVNVAYNLSTEAGFDFVTFGANLASDKQVRVSGQKTDTFSVDLTGNYDYMYRIDFRADGSVALSGVSITISTSSSPQFAVSSATDTFGYATTSYPNYWTESFSTNYNPYYTSAPYNPYPDYGYTTPYYGYYNPTTYYPYNPYPSYSTPSPWPSYPNDYPSYTPSPPPQYPYDPYPNTNDQYLRQQLWDTLQQVISIAQNILNILEQSGFNGQNPNQYYYGYAQAAAGKK